MKNKLRVPSKTKNIRPAIFVSPKKPIPAFNMYIENREWGIFLSPMPNSVFGLFSESLSATEILYCSSKVRGVIEAKCKRKMKAKNNRADTKKTSLFNDDFESNCNNENCPRREEFKTILNDLIEEWHKSETILKLSEYLSMTDAEYMRWIHTKEIPDGVFGLNKFQERIK